MKISVFRRSDFEINQDLRHCALKSFMILTKGFIHLLQSLLNSDSMTSSEGEKFFFNFKAGEICSDLPLGWKNLFKTELRLNLEPVLDKKSWSRVTSEELNLLVPWLFLQWISKLAFGGFVFFCVRNLWCRRQSWETGEISTNLAARTNFWPNMNLSRQTTGKISTSPAALTRPCLGNGGSSTRPSPPGCSTSEWPWTSRCRGWISHLGRTYPSHGTWTLWRKTKICFVAQTQAHKD